MDVVKDVKDQFGHTVVLEQDWSNNWAIGSLRAFPQHRIEYLQSQHLDWIPMETTPTAFNEIKFLYYKKANVGVIQCTWISVGLWRMIRFSAPAINTGSWSLPGEFQFQSSLGQSMRAKSCYVTWKGRKQIGIYISLSIKNVTAVVYGLSPRITQGG